MKLFTLITAVFISSLSYSAVCESTGNGDWNDASSWTCGSAPGCGDTVLIQAGHEIKVTEQNDYTACSDSIYLLVEGFLAFTNGNKLQLPCGSELSISPTGQIYKDGNGGGNSTLLSICNNTVWSAGDGTMYGPYNWNGSLPIELIDFKAVNKNDNAKIIWKTASEINCDYYLLQKSSDGYSFETIYKTQGQTNSNSLLTYQYIDHETNSGITYYRL